MTSRGGRDCRSATPAPGSGRSRPSSSSATTASSTWPAVPRPPSSRHRGCLGAYEPLLLGWASRDFLLGAHRTIVAVNGLFRPFALVDGRAVATWSLSAGEVALKPFARLEPEDADALAADAGNVLRFLSA